MHFGNRNFKHLLNVQILASDIFPYLANIDFGTIKFVYIFNVSFFLYVYICIAKHAT